MKRLLAFGLSLGFVAALAVPALAGGLAEKATGSGTFINGSGDLVYVEFNAHEPKENQPAKGWLYQNVTGVGWYVVDIDFVGVGLYDACFSGEIVYSTHPSNPVGSTRATVVHDGGEPGIGVDTFAGQGGSSCPWTKTPYAITSGNFQVQGAD